MKDDYKLVAISADLHVPVPEGLGLLHEEEYICKALADRPFMDAEYLDMIEAVACPDNCSSLDSMLKELEQNLQ